MTDTDPTPVFPSPAGHGRALAGFPWIQLVFCLACLGTSGLVTVNYSMAWDTAIAEVNSMPVATNPWVGRYVRLHTSAEFVGMREHRWPQEPGDYGLLDERGPGEVSNIEKTVFFRASRDPTHHGLRYELQKRVAVDGYLEGRVHIDPAEYPARPFWIDATASRFHPASIAGLVVGAMGCFIFGLYLRRWLRERTARAHAPQRDMLA